MSDYEQKDGDIEAQPDAPDEALKDRKKRRRGTKGDVLGQNRRRRARNPLRARRQTREAVRRYRARKKLEAMADREGSQPDI